MSRSLHRRAVHRVLLPPTPTIPSRPRHSPKRERLRRTKGSEGAEAPVRRRPHSGVPVQRAATAEGTRVGGPRGQHANPQRCPYLDCGGERVRGGDRRPHAPRRLCGACSGGARARRREAAACRAGTSRADGLEGPDHLPPGSVRPISGRSEWSSHRTTSPLPAALPYAGRGGLGGHRTPPPRPDTSGFSALWPLPSSPRVRPLHRGSRTKLPEAGGGS